VFVNGRFAPRLSSLEALRGVRVRCLRHVLRDEPDGAAAHLGSLSAALEAHPFAALNGALFEDGALVEVEPGAQPDEPLHLLHVSLPDEGGPPSLCLPRTLVVVGRGSRLRLVETYGGHPGQPALIDAVTEVVLLDGAQLDRTRLQREGDAAYHLALSSVRLGRDARFVDHAVSVGAALSRHDIDVVLDGEGAECVLDGLFLAEGAQHSDTHTRIDHARPHGTSRELYKGVLDGRARGVFHGLMVVREGAQKSDAWQSNRNLLLSTQALVHSTPQLEIRADDVKCKHGSTTGQLDPQALFYLRSRGLGEEAARALLTWAFAAEIVQRLEVEPVRARLAEYLHERLPQAPREEEA
jgi:Fe-S cluster assembly protein SufD